MQLYDTIIKDTLDALKAYTPKVWAADGDKWKKGSRNDLLFSSDTAYELGGNGKESVGYTAVTTDASLVPKHSIMLYGRDIRDISADTSFAQIAVIAADEIEGDENALYHAIKDIELSVYDIYLKGLMVRQSFIDNRFQMRVGKYAVKEGASFRTIGNAIIDKYESDKRVKSATMIFVTEDYPEFAALKSLAKKTDSITAALNKALSGMNADCRTCNLKDICDEVEDLRKLHFGKK